MAKPLGHLSADAQINSRIIHSWITDDDCGHQLTAHRRVTRSNQAGNSKVTHRPSILTVQDQYGLIHGRLLGGKYRHVCAHDAGAAIRPVRSRAASGPSVATIIALDFTLVPSSSITDPGSMPRTRVFNSTEWQPPAQQVARQWTPCRAREAHCRRGKACARRTRTSDSM